MRRVWGWYKAVIEVAVTGYMVGFLVIWAVGSYLEGHFIGTEEVIDLAKGTLKLLFH